MPKPKPLTKWQQFAQSKGIVKQKKSKFVWDEAKKEWGRRYGYKKANDDTKPWLIEVPQNSGLFPHLKTQFPSKYKLLIQIPMKINLLNDHQRKKNV